MSRLWTEDELHVCNRQNCLFPGICTKLFLRFSQFAFAMVMLGLRVWLGEGLQYFCLENCQVFYE